MASLFVFLSLGLSLVVAGHGEGPACASCSELRNRVEKLESLLLRYGEKLDTLIAEKKMWESKYRTLDRDVKILMKKLNTNHASDTQPDVIQADTDTVTEINSASEPETSFSDDAHANRPSRDVMTRADDTDPVEAVVTQMSQRLNEVSAQVQANTARVQEAASSVYVRWGHSQCPGSSTLVYSGWVGGSPHTDTGAAVNYLCLTQSPVISSEMTDVWGAHVYGAEYEHGLQHSHDKDAVCAVCRSHHPNTIMIPGTNVCLSGWTTEYTGFLMADSHQHPAASEFVCVDHAFQSRAGSEENHNGKLFYFSVAVCGSLPCGPYVNSTRVTCAVCSK